MPLRLHEWAVRITISITLRKSEARCSTHRYCPSAHPVSSIGTPRHPNHRPSCTSALDTDEKQYRLHLLLMPKSSQTSLTRFLAESGADTRERNRLLRRGSLTHVSDFTAHSLCSPCTFRKRKRQFYGLAPQGGRGVLTDKERGKFPFSTPFRLTISLLTFSKPNKLNNLEKLTWYFSVRMPMNTGFSRCFQTTSNC